jgi:hypothetical protein
MGVAPLGTYLDRGANGNELPHLIDLSVRHGDIHAIDSWAKHFGTEPLATM